MAHILVIDDDDLALESMKIILEESGHTVSLAGNGNEGLNLVRQQSFDLVITDLIMPEKEGIGTLMEIKQDYPDLKVLVVSGGGRDRPDTYLQTAEALGADGALAKPFGASELMQHVERLI